MEKRSGSALIDFFIVPLYDKYPLLITAQFFSR